MTDLTKPPKVFISYAWEDDILPWVKTLAKRLRKDGVETILDQWETDYGDQLPEFMEKAVRESDFVIIICTPKYKKKSNDREGGVGYEGHIITAEIFEKNNQRKFIPVLRKGGWNFSAPSWAAGKLYTDLSGNPYKEENYRKLLRTLLGKKPTPPPVGAPPEFSDDDDDVERPKPFANFFTALKSNVFEAFTILKLNLSKAIPVLRVIGLIGVFIVLLWGGSWAIPKFISLIPALKVTNTQLSTAQATPTNSPVPPTKTTIPSKTPQPSLTPTLDALQPIITPTTSPTPSIFGDWLFQFDDGCDKRFWGTSTLKINTDRTLEMPWQVSTQNEPYNFKTVLNLDGQWVRWSLGITKFDGKWDGENMTGTYIGGIGGTAGCWKATKK